MTTLWYSLGTVRNALVSLWWSSVNNLTTLNTMQVFPIRYSHTCNIKKWSVLIDVGHFNVHSKSSAGSGDQLPSKEISDNTFSLKCHSKTSVIMIITFECTIISQYSTDSHSRIGIVHWRQKLLKLQIDYFKEDLFVVRLWFQLKDTNPLI